MGRIIGLFLAICIFFVNTAGAATKEKEAENAYLTYACALADTMAYNTVLSSTVRDLLVKRGWEIDTFRHNDSRAETNFILVKHKSPVTGQIIMMVAVPGTEKSKDAEVDLRFGKVVFGGSDVEGFKAAANTAETVSTDPMVHRGFNDYTMTAFFLPREDSKTGADVLRNFAMPENTHLYITGHSLCGAVATILGARLLALGVPADQFTVVTFGAPAVGNQAFADAYGSKLDLQRYTIGGDPVKGALQVLKSGYVQFGNEGKWQRNENSVRFSHAMSEYLDAGIRNYYDVITEGELTEKKMLEIRHPEGSLTKQPAISYGRISSKNKIYFAPVSIKLDDNIANDAAYMKVVAADVIGSNFNKLVQGENMEAAAGKRPGNTDDEAEQELDAVFQHCNLASEAGCDTVAMVKINGKADRNKKNLYQLSVETSFYNTEGQLLANMSANSSTDDISPIEAVLYSAGRISDVIAGEQLKGTLNK